jgi:hypothetical protein
LRQENTPELNHQQFYAIFYKISTKQAQRTGNLKQKHPQVCKPQCRNMKQQVNRSPSKATSITKDLNNSEEKEISSLKFQKIIRMINKVKDETHKLGSEPQRGHTS